MNKAIIMTDKKKQAAAIAAVKTIVEVSQEPVTRDNTPPPWAQQGKQAIMANRTNMQMRFARK